MPDIPIYVYPLLTEGYNIGCGDFFFGGFFLDATEHSIKKSPQAITARRGPLAPRRDTGQDQRYLWQFGDPTREASFLSSGDLRSSWTESMSSRDEKLSLTWYDLGEPFLSHRLPGGSPERPHGVATVLIPADGARLTVNGQFAKGRPFPRQRDGRTHSTCALAFSESWLLPY